MYLVLDESDDQSVRILKSHSFTRVVAGGGGDGDNNGTRFITRWFETRTRGNKKTQISVGKK